MTYAGAYGRDRHVPVDRMLRREGHPLGVRRAEATKVATEEPEESQNHKRWTLGAAAGALLVAGTFAAGALGITGGAADTAGSAPEHAPAAPGHTPGSGPVAGAPAPGQENQQEQPRDQQEQPRQTTPASAEPRAGVPVAADTGATGSGSATGDGQRTTEPSTSTPAPAPAPEPAPAPAPAEQQGPVGGLVDTVGDVLTPVTDVVGGILSPSSATTTSTTAPAGPALTMIDPLGDLVGN